MIVCVVMMVGLDGEDEGRVPDNVGAFVSLDGAFRFIDECRAREAALSNFLVIEDEFSESLIHTGGRAVPWAEDWQWRLWGERRVLTRTDDLDYWSIEAVEVKP